MYKLAVIGGAALALAASAVASPAVAAPPSGKVTLDVVTVNGTGCPAGTVAVAVNSDNTAFTATYSDYLAESGSGVSITQNRKACQMSLLVHVPSGFTFAVAQADYRGYAQLARGATGTVQASYYFMGESATATSTHTFRGPLADNWQTTDRTAVASLVYKPCGVDRNLNVKSALRVAPSNLASFMAMDSTDGSVSTIFRFAWKSC